MYICIHMYNTQLFGHIWPYVEYTQIKYIALHYITLPCNVLHYIGLHLHYIHTHTQTHVINQYLVKDHMASMPNLWPQHTQTSNISC